MFNDVWPHVSRLRIRLLIQNILILVRDLPGICYRVVSV